MTVDTAFWTDQRQDASASFDRVLELHRSHKSTLGLLTYEAFREAARRGHLVLGFVDGNLAGYTVFSTPRMSTVRLIHVCVDKSARRQGLARAMVDAIVAENPNRIEVVAHCRVDYKIDDFWRSLDMSPTSERSGRAANGSKIKIWTRRFGQLDLFESALADSPRPLAVLDSNIVIDQHSSEALSRPDREESLGLAADWLVDVVKYAVSPEVGIEVGQLEPESERSLVQNSLGSLVTLRREAGGESLIEELRERIGRDALIADPSLENDVRHLADAIGAKADYFVTRDTNLAQVTNDWIFKDFQLQVVRPGQLIASFIPPSAPTEFRSGQLESAGLQWTRVKEATTELAQAYTDVRNGERSRHFQKQLVGDLSRPDIGTLDELLDARGRRWGLLGARLDGERLIVSTLRVGRGSLGPSVAFQLARYLRDLALQREASGVAIVEPHLAPFLRRALEADGFSGSPLQVDVRRVLPEGSGLPRGTARDVAAFERVNWPQVVLGSRLPVRILPIQPTYARELLGFNDSLLIERDRRSLGLVRELVYFSTPAVKNWDLPSRVLWYVSASPKDIARTAVRAVVAHSRLVGAEVVAARTAVEKYRSLGALRGREIEEFSRRGEVLVLRFEDTHLLEHPVGRGVLDQLARKHGTSNVRRRATDVAPEFFDDILRLQDESSNA